MKFAKCEIPLFGRHVLVAMDCSEDTALLHFTEFCREYGEGAFVNLERVCTASGWAQVSCGDIYLWSKDSVAVLLHEIVHAAFKLCREIDARVDEEMIARLVEYMKLNLVDKLEEVK